MKSKYKLPTAFTTLIIISIVIALLTFVIPAGQYSFDENSRPIAGSYAAMDANPQGIWDICAAPIKGFNKALDVALFVLILGGCLGVLFETRAIDAGFAKVAKKLKGRERLMIPILLGICMIGGSTYGLAEETIAFYPIIVPILLAAGYDVVTAVMVIFLGAGLGVGAAIINPFNVGIASSLANISVGEGIAARLLLFVAYLAFGIFFVMRYAEKVKKNPEKSIVYDIKETVEAPFKKHSDEEIPEMNKKRRNILIVFGMLFAIMIVSLIPWDFKFGITFFTDINNAVQSIPVLGKAIGHTVAFGDWYFQELTVLFLVGAVIIGKMYGMKEDQIVKQFIIGAKDLLSVALILGVARGISVIMVDGHIIGTVLHAGEQILSELNSVVFAAIAYVVYIPLSFLIPSSSGLATASIPIMAPLSDFAGVGREYMVMAFAAGAETMNFFSPTQAVLVGALTLCGIPFGRWLKVITPFVLGVMGITIAVLAIGIMFI